MGKDTFYANTAVIIPVYNEEKVIGEVVNSVLKQFKYVICVNDGSRDKSAAQIAKTKAHLVNHPINMGQGAALQTGLEYAKTFPDVDYFVNFDADGQHRLEDVQLMLTTIKKKKVDIILGSRFLGEVTNITKLKKMVLKAAVIFTNITTGLKLTDTHNGLRVFNRHAANHLQITMPDMAHASEILSLIKRHKLSYVEVPVTIAYTDYSKAKGQSIFNSVNIVFDLMMKGKR